MKQKLTNTKGHKTKRNSLCRPRIGKVRVELRSHSLYFSKEKPHLPRKIEQYWIMSKHVRNSLCFSLLQENTILDQNSFQEIAIYCKCLGRAVNSVRLFPSVCRYSLLYFVISCSHDNRNCVSVTFRAEKQKELNLLSRCLYYNYNTSKLLFLFKEHNKYYFVYFTNLKYLQTK